MSLTATDAPIGDDVDLTEKTVEVAGRSLWQITWGRLRRDRTAMLCVWIMGFFIVLAIFAPLINHLVGVDPYTPDSSAISDNAGQPYGPWAGARRQHPLGVEWGTGRDIFAQLVNGLRISLLIAFAATVAAVAIGTVVGIISGYLGGRTDAFIGRIIDVMLSFPSILLLLALIPVLDDRFSQIGLEGNAARVLAIILVLAVFGWPYLARIVRGQVLSLREREFVESAVAMGSSTTRILFKEILPNLWAPLLVYATNLLPGYIAAEAGLSFFGIGILPPETTFGSMLGNSLSYFLLEPSYLFIPGTVLAILVVAINLLGDSVRDALDPRAGRN